MAEDVTAEQIAEVLDRLEAASRKLAAAFGALADRDAHTVGPDDAWSPADILAHLRASHAIIQPRIYHILVRDNPPLILFDAETWQQVAGYDRLKVRDSVHALAQARAELIAALVALPAADWQRTGVHEMRGPISVMDIARALADHDEEHVQQLEALSYAE